MPCTVRDEAISTIAACAFPPSMPRTSTTNHCQPSHSIITKRPNWSTCIQKLGVKVPLTCHDTPRRIRDCNIPPLRQALKPGTEETAMSKLLNTTRLLYPFPRHRLHRRGVARARSGLSAHTEDHSVSGSFFGGSTRSSSLPCPCPSVLCNPHGCIAEFTSHGPILAPALSEACGEV